MTMHTENWLGLIVQVLPVLIKMLFGKKNTKLDFLEAANMSILPAARMRRREG